MLLGQAAGNTMPLKQLEASFIDSLHAYSWSCVSSTFILSHISLFTYVSFYSND